MDIKKYFIFDIAPDALQNFDCGEEWSMSYFLRYDALEAYRQGQAMTNVFVDCATGLVLGYYSLKSNSFLHKYVHPYSGCAVSDTVPCVEIARFALDKQFQRQKLPGSDIKYSEYLMSEALQDINDLREYLVGVKAVMLFSLNKPKQIHFYHKFGFKEFAPSDGIHQSTEVEGCLPMYLLLPPIEIAH
ncbi:MAG: hypothetical protein IJ849_10790 [Selenomonadaceae bacterium]|nr:hypothetical protein [Selenomonadaceae bacterium]